MSRSRSCKPQRGKSHLSARWLADSTSLLLLAIGAIALIHGDLGTAVAAVTGSGLALRR